MHQNKYVFVHVLNYCSNFRMEYANLLADLASFKIFGKKKTNYVSIVRIP